MAREHLLSVPIEARGEVVRSVRFRPVTGVLLVEFDTTMRLPPVACAVARIGLFTGLPRDAVEQLDLDDVQSLSAAIAVHLEEARALFSDPPTKSRH